MINSETFLIYFPWFWTDITAWSLISPIYGLEDYGDEDDEDEDIDFAYFQFQ